jgi:hypothetical protein
MKKIKHSKFKNTGMLFELLTRQITSDIISSNESVAISILKKHFGKNTELLKEYTLYKTLCDERLKSETRANILIDAVIKSKNTINKKKLNEEKYELIKAIRDNFDVNLFFQTKVQNYKLLASIYKLLEYKELDNPLELTKSKITILENITTKSRKELVNEFNLMAKQPKDVRVLSQKLLVEKFNKKYSDLSDNQKNLLREYIENVSNTNNLKLFVQSESSNIHKIFKNNIHKVTNKTLKIKLNEIVNLLEEYKNIKNVEENHISALLRYYSIIQDLSWSK